MSDDPSNAELQRQVVALSATVAALTTTIVDLRMLVVELATRVRLSSCPSPGSCVPLGENLKKVQEDVEHLKALAAERRGERGVLAVLCTIVGSSIGAIVSWMLTHK
jgi:hypothetical protein